MEICPRGLWNSLGKRVSGKPDRGFESLNLRKIGKLSEWLKEHAWKACAAERVP